MVFIRKTKTYLLHLRYADNPFVLAKDLRKKQTEAEVLLWNKLKSRKCGGYKFRRQHPIRQYIADFYCHEQRLVIEVDGKIHLSKDQREKDLNRTAELERYGIRVLRFKNEEVFHSLDTVSYQIIDYLKINPIK